MNATCAGLWPAEVIPRCEMVRADCASRHHVLPSSSSTFAWLEPMPRSRDLTLACKTERRDDALELGSLEEVKMSSPEASGSVRYRTLAVRLTALRAPLPENSNDFALLCAQVYAERCHRGSFVDQDQCRASSPPARAPQRRSASFSGQCAHA